MNKSGQKVAATQGKEHSSCIKLAAAGKLVGMDADQCIVADSKSKVGKAEGKTSDTQASKCAFPFPPYGYTSASTVNTAAKGEELSLLEDIFSFPLDPIIATSNPAAACQSAVSKTYEKFAATYVKEYNGCKKSGFKDGIISGATQMEACMGQDLKGKIGKASQKILDGLAKKCVGVDLATAFPGDCVGEAGNNNTFAACVERATVCRMCLAINEMDAIARGCDDLDDGLLNATCRQCGNGATEAPEECDDSGESATCDADCTNASCGDGTVNATAGETCDDADASDNDMCPTTCLEATCGDGFLCNEGGCTTGPSGGVEQCDDGGANSDVTPDACRTTCRPAYCGDGVVDTGEQCDTAGQSATCDANCTLPVCGDGTLNAAAGEGCDDGNLNDDDSCPSTCQPATCGDGFLCTAPGCTTGPTGGAEQCDDAGANSDVTPDACRTDCANPGCGDNVTDTGEQCDTGGNSVTCDGNCTLPLCGDGTFNPAAGEGCDDGNVNDNDPCPSTCQPATCGDGFLCSSGGCTTGPTGGAEQCDDNGANSNVTPDACRTNCENPGCGDGVIDTGEQCDTSGQSAGCDSNCTFAVCGDGTLNTAAGEQCDGGGETVSCDVDCTTRVCGDGYVNVVAGEECDDGNLTPGDGCNATCLCGPGSGEIGCQDALCPNRGKLVLYAGTTGVACANNGDCDAGTCDTGLGVCKTATELDTGWTGLAHDSDTNDQVVTIGRLLCEGPFDGMSAEPCGQCEVLGLSADTGDCRCANDNRVQCDVPFGNDADDCGGGACNCYFGPPLPLSSANTPACVVNRFANDVSGTVNVDLGSGTIAANLASVVYLGINVLAPCPACGGTCTAPAGSIGDPCANDLDCDSSFDAGDGVCGNYDPVPGDGNRDGTCWEGEDAGLPCDIGFFNGSFPAPGGNGAGLSLDCFPSSGLNVSGTGLKISLEQTTGVASLPVAAVPCGFNGQNPVPLCPCGECSNDITVPCTSNSDCVSPGVCQKSGNGKPRPNQCVDEICTNMGGGEGACLANPPLGFCDGIVRNDNNGFLSCNNNGDCAVLGTLAGNCTLTSTKECFVDPIVAVGTADPETPVGAAAFCIARTSNAGINDVAGLPGPGRIKNAAGASTFCASNNAVQYTPGVGGCP